MRGVQAAVLMEGQADIARETQDLRVVVVPEINAGTASLVSAAINPAVGLGSFLAQFLLRQPLHALPRAQAARGQAAGQRRDQCSRAARHPHGRGFRPQAGVAQRGFAGPALQQCGAAVVLAKVLQAKFIHQGLQVGLQGRPVPGRPEVEAVRSRLPRGVHGEDAAARPVTRLQHGAVHARLLQPVGADQAGEAAANDEHGDVHGAGIVAVPRRAMDGHGFPRPRPCPRRTVSVKYSAYL